jgi:hypothetical protein
MGIRGVAGSTCNLLLMIIDNSKTVLESARLGRTAMKTYLMLSFHFLEAPRPQCVSKPVAAIVTPQPQKQVTCVDNLV